MAAKHTSLLVQMIKDTMDKKFGPAWQVIVGKGFSYNVNYEVGTTHISLYIGFLGTSCRQHDHVLHVQVKNLLYLFVGGVTGVLLWKT